jgi:hypothetical protein
MDGYAFEIKTTVQLQGDGSLSRNNYTSVFVHRHFIVDVETGCMIGDVTNHNGTLGQPQVIFRGDTENSLRVLTVYHPNPSTDLLEVETFVKGPVKPFLFTSNSHIMAGTCRPA